jgi:polyisoprenyl-phosphate glycosyltransferase
MAKTSQKQDIFVSVVLIANESLSATIGAIEELSQLLTKKYTNHEIVCVTQNINSLRHTKIQSLINEVPCIRVIGLAKKDNTDVLIFAGIESAIGDSVVVFLAGKDPVKLVPEFVERNKDYDIVFGISEGRTRKGVINEYGSRVFYWYNKKFLGISIPNKSTYFVAFNRRAINALTRTGRYARHIRHLSRQIGYPSSELSYSQHENSSDKKSLRTLFMSAIELATNYSNHPLRFVSWLGFSVALLNVLYAGYVILVKIFKQEVAEGWTTTSLQLSIMFFFLFAILAILAEYVGKVLEESRGEPPYYIIDELSSKVSVADATRRNIEK